MAATIAPGNLHLAGKYLESLPSGDISRRYLAGEKYQTSFWQRTKMLFTVRWYIKEIQSFYPYQFIIHATNKNYSKSCESALKNGLIVTAASWYY